jgi:hypothetical protein
MNERIGATLIRIGAMKPFQVVDVINAQEAGDSRMFGEIAIDLGYINDEVLRKYVEAKAAWDQQV